MGKKLAIQGISYNLAGTVTSLGLPVKGTLIRLYDYQSKNGRQIKSFLNEQVTGSTGNFNFDVNQGLYCVEVIPDANTRFSRQSFESLGVTGNTNFNVSLKAGFILAGKVCDTAGNALSKCEILVFGFDTCLIRAVQAVEEDGCYSITLPAGKYHLALQYKENNSNLDQTPFLYPGLQVVDLHEDLSWNFVVPELKRLSLSLNDPDNNPVSDVLVRVTALERPAVVFSRELDLTLAGSTRQDGKFECRLLPGRYGLHFEAPADSDLAQTTINSFEVLNDSSPRYTLEWGYRWSGQVSFQGQPVSNAVITAFNAETSSECIADEEGRYMFSLLPGDYDYTVLSPPGLSEFDSPTAPLIGKLSLEQDTDKVLALEEGFLISGRILDTAKKARSGILVSLFPTREGIFDGRGICSRSIAAGLVDDDGSYELRLMPDSYWLVVNNQLSAGYKIDIDENKKTLLIEDVCVITFEVTGENEMPVPRCLVNFESYSLKPGACGDYAAITDEGGKCTLTLPAGIYSFNFQPPASSTFSSKLIRQLSVMGDMNRRIRLSSQ